jgi:hypothetical protein
MNPAEAYIMRHALPYRAILMHLKMVIEDTLPGVVMKYKWQIPCFYHGASPLCYMNVSQKEHYVDLGFWNAAHLTKHLDKMVSKNRRVVRSLRYSSLEEIDETVLKTVLQEAYALRMGGFYKKIDLD